MNEDFSPESVAATIAAIQGSGHSVVEKFTGGKVEFITLESDKGKVITASVNDDAIIAVITEPNINFGLVRVGIRKATEKISKLLYE